MAFKYPEDTVGGAKERLSPRTPFWDRRYMTRIDGLVTYLEEVDALCVPKTVTLVDLGNGFLVNLPKFTNPKAKVNYVIIKLLIDSYGCK